jgi:hypothetical protein
VRWRARIVGASLGAALAAWSAQARAAPSEEELVPIVAGLLGFCCLAVIVVTGVPTAIAIISARSRNGRHVLGVGALLAAIAAIGAGSYQLGREILRADTLGEPISYEECGEGGTMVVGGHRSDDGSPYSRRAYLTVSDVLAARLPLPVHLEERRYMGPPDPDYPEEHEEMRRAWLEETIEVAVWPSQPGLGTYELEHERFVLVVLASSPDREDSTLSLGDVVRYEIVPAGWVQAWGGWIAIHTFERGGTLELRAADLGPRRPTIETGLLLDPQYGGSLYDGAGGLYLTGDSLSDALIVWHVRADGTTARSVIDIENASPDLSHARSGGLCAWDRSDRALHLSGEPLALVRWERSLVLRERSAASLALLFAFLVTGLALGAVAQRARVVAPILRGPLRVGTTVGVDGEVRWVDADGSEHRVGSEARWLTAQPVLGAAVAVASASEAPAAAPYREGRASIRITMLVPGTLESARALARSYLLDRAAVAGLVVLVLAVPPVLYALFELFAS